ncbi:putative oxidoreductase [Starmerella bacillaris]|uniref:Oxidoreductase n=1 Tax=Starmerella bacillaris TaxID=1247836 RepID=A0AAV5RFK5_STABA|nr:putative oxidoreductase [Starmerella bacillaris]
MPVNFLATVYVEGRQAIPYYDTLKVAVPALTLLYAMKYYFAGKRNTWQRDMHGKVVLITGGTSGLGAQTAKELAALGAQIVFLVRNVHDGWLIEYINDLREATNNQLIYAEEVDLTDLYSVRKFATKWIDNLPPRRLDMIICCASVSQPISMPRQTTKDELEPQFQVNYLGHFLLLDILAPAIRAQPPDREVRIILTSCASSLTGEFNLEDLGYLKRNYPAYRPFLVFGEAKLYLALSAYELFRQFNNYKRKDGAPCNVHVSVVDPGMMRSPGFKRFITFGRLSLLFVYLLLWPLSWLFLKSSVDGAQSMAYAAMSPEVVEKREVAYISNCQVRPPPPRSEFKDPEKQAALVKETHKLIEAVEKNSAIERNKFKKDSEKKKEQEKKKEKVNKDKPASKK